MTEKFDQTRAMAEGWCVMWSDSRGQFEIQRDDEQPTFARDDDALAHVAKAAAAGSDYHREALALCLPEPTTPPRRRQFNIRMDDRLAAAIQRAAKRNRRSMSDYVRGVLERATAEA